MAITSSGPCVQVMGIGELAVQSAPSCGLVPGARRKRHLQGLRLASAITVVLATAIIASASPGAVAAAWAAVRLGGLTTKQGGRERALRLVSRRAEGDDDSEEAEDTTNVELFRQSLIQGWGGGEVGSRNRGALTDWAELVSPASVRAGDLLLADPEQFFGEGPAGGPQRVGLKNRVPEDYPRRERLRFLPVVLLTNVDADTGEAEGVWLTMRTGQLMGDFVNNFHSRPLLYGGPVDASLTMVHPYPQVPGSKPLADGGLYLGGSLAGAQAWVDDGQGSSLRFRFFLNRVRWSAGELQAELAPPDRTWLTVRCSIDLVLSESDSIDNKPLWVQIAELAGGEAQELGRLHDLMEGADE